MIKSLGMDLSSRRTFGECNHHFHHRLPRFRFRLFSVLCLLSSAVITETWALTENGTTNDDDDASLEFNLSDFEDDVTTWNPLMSDGDNVTLSSNYTDVVVEPEYFKIALIMGEDSLPYEEIQAIRGRVEDDSFRFETIFIDDLEPSLKNFRRAVRSLRPEKPEAIIGPYSLTYAITAQHLRIPFVVTSPIPKKKELTEFFLIRLFPEANVFARSVVDMLTYYHLKKVVVFFASEAGEAIIESLAGVPKLHVTAFKVTPETVIELRQQLKMVRDEYFTSFVGILDKEDTKKLLDEAVTLSMFSPRYKWLMVNMGLEEYDLEKYVDSYANVTVIRLMMDYNSTDCDLEPSFINLKRSLLHDALQLSSQFENHWDNRRRRPNLRKLKMYGCTGDLIFSKKGHRTESFLQLMTLDGYKAGVSGTWRSNRSLLTQRIDPSKSYSIVSKLSENVFGLRPLRITTKMEPPFVQEKDAKSIETNHPEFEGFCIDILVELSKLLKFTFNITKVPDGKYGSLKPPPRYWTGMIRLLKDDVADIALAPFQMSTERATVVDFTKPFMTKGTTVVVKRPDQRIWMFQFLSPLNQIVWFAIFIAFIGVSLMLFAVSRVNSDRQAKYTSNLRESFWYIWGTLLRGSLSGSPSAISSRIVSSVWWFFCLIISSIYTANLAAFLTITNSDVGMSTAADLALQSEYDYGTVEGSQTETFFKHTHMTYYARMWAHMSVLSENSMSRTVDIGFERVRKGKYAFIWDSPTIRHTISTDCDLMEIGSPFDLKGYGFAFQKNAPYGERLSWALLKLNDRGVLYKLERKWWRPQFCPSRKKSAQSQSLQLETVAGMYVIILSGAVISTLICLLQYFIRELRARKKRNTQEDNNKDATDGNVRSNNYSDLTGQRDEITYANHSPLTFRPISEWT